MRLDVYLTKELSVESRNKASMLISRGDVSVNGKLITKPSYDVDDGDQILINDNSKLYVSRSATKLITAIEKFSVDFNEKIAVDLGASTGGFTQVMLENNVKKVYAVDIGTNQLHPVLKSDTKVINKEHINARYISAATFDSSIDIVTCDLSFISLSMVLNAVYCTLKEGGEFICLIKPQFEAGKNSVNKNGVVKDLKIHISVIADIIEQSTKLGFSVKGLSFSGLEGEAGNREYLLYLVKDLKGDSIATDVIHSVVFGEI